MALVNRFRWQGPGRLYSLPWMKHRLEYSADPRKIAAYAKSDFTRSRLTMEILTRFHLSQDSIVVSDDDHAAFLRKLSLMHLPPAARITSIARALAEGVFVPGSPPLAGRTIHLSKELIREVYVSLLTNVLGVNILSPLAAYINERLAFQPSVRPMHFEGLMYAIGLHLPAFAPVRLLVDLLLYGREREARRVARQLQRMIFEFATPKPGGWYSTLLDLKSQARITPAQFRGELTSILVSSFSLSAAISSMVLCLAARPEYVAKIRRDRRLPRCFVNEVLRLYPPFRQFGYERQGVCATTPSRGEATDFMVALFALHRNRDAWQKPERFYPERFLEPGAAGGGKFLPFGMGKRACPGRVYSLNLMIELVTYLCSDSCGISLQLPADYRGTTDRLPVGASGRLVSFPIDDRVTYVRPGDERIGRDDGYSPRLPEPDGDHLCGATSPTSTARQDRCGSPARRG